MNKEPDKMSRDQFNSLNKFLEENIRFDGRKKEEYRQVTVTPGVSATAEGSAEVRIGNTMVLAGVKLEAGTPYPDSPDEGVLMVGVELSPIANKDFETGPPGFDAIELARVTDRAIRESRAMDTKALCIKEGEKVWIASVDITVMNDDGNLFDACSVAAIAAIKDTKLLKLDKNNVPDYHEKTKEGLPLVKTPVSVTVYKLGDHLLVDPTLRELEAASARLTVGSIDDGTLCSMQKGGDGTLTKDDVVAMTALAVEKAAELRKLI